jgi:hypothetical protein
VSNVAGEASEVVSAKDSMYDMGRQRALPKPPPLFRLRCWIAKALLPEAAVREARNMLVRQVEERDKAKLAEHMQIDGPSIAFTLIKADNGHIIRYQSRDPDSPKLARSTDRLYLVPEGNKVIESIATIIAKAKLE